MSTLFSHRNMDMVRNRGFSNSKVTGKKKRKSKVKVKYFPGDSENGSDASAGRSRTPSDEEFSEDDLFYPIEYDSDEPLIKRVKKVKKRNGISHKQVARANVPAVEDEEEYYVERILDMKIVAGKRKFYVKWLNYDSEENTWEPEENMQGCKQMTEEFLERIKKPKSHALNGVSRTRPENQNSVNKTNNRRNGFAQETYKPDSIDKLSNSLPHIPNDYTPDSANELCNSPPHIPEDYVQIPRRGNLFYFRIIQDGELNFIYIDSNESLKESDDIKYKCVVTEDLTGKQPKLIYGATTSVDGEKFCLVEFEGHSYVEVVPPEIFFKKFPTFRKFFEVHCPLLFAREQ